MQFRTTPDLKKMTTKKEGCRPLGTTPLLGDETLLGPSSNGSENNAFGYLITQNSVGEQSGRSPRGHQVLLIKDRQAVDDGGITVKLEPDHLGLGRHFENLGKLRLGRCAVNRMTDVHKAAVLIRIGIDRELVRSQFLTGRGAQMGRLQGQQGLDVFQKLVHTG
jgi:hypothetical protein